MRVAIAEDSGFFRDALATSMESVGIEVVRKASTADELISHIEQDRPDVVVLDICLPPTKTDEGLVAAELLGKKYPFLGILVLSAYLAMPHVTRLFASGRSHIGCLAKDQLHDTAVLIDALQRIKNGGIVVDPDFVTHRLHAERLKQVLTERELQMLQVVAEGHSNAGIAGKLHVGIKTVESTLTSIFRKLQIDSRDSNARVRAVLLYLSKPQSFIEKQGDF